jgi:tRNA(Ile)-lysidine synthase TilS/MesJ
MDRQTRCNKCLLPGSAPRITFDNDHICNYCRTYKKTQLKGEAALQGILKSAKSGHSEYDCIVNISGGRDSSYTILKMIKDYDMRVLAVNYANPFTNRLAKENIENIKNILGVKLISFAFSDGFHQRVLKSNLLALINKPDPAMVPMVCVSCKLMWKNILDIANAHNIRLIVSGGNFYEQSSFKRILLGGSPDQSVRRYYTQFVLGLIKHSLLNVKYLRLKTLLPTIQGYLYCNPYSPLVRWKGRHIDKIDMFHYLPWNEDEVISRNQKELNWQYPQNGSGSWRFDCRIGHLKDYLYLKMLGLTEKDDFYSHLIREGKMTRSDALNRIDTENRVNMSELNQLMKSIDLDIGILAGQQGWT